MMKVENDLGRDDIRKLVLRIAIPSMLAQFVNVLYSIVDRMFIGNIPVIGEQALAGAGICGPIVTLITSFASLVGIGGAPLLSIRLGAKDENFGQLFYYVGGVVHIDSSTSTQHKGNAAAGIRGQ